jgi:hypothetical protein
MEGKSNNNSIFRAVILGIALIVSVYLIIYIVSNGPAGRFWIPKAPPSTTLRAIFPSSCDETCVKYGFYSGNCRYWRYGCKENEVDIGNYCLSHHETCCCLLSEPTTTTISNLTAITPKNKTIKCWNAYPYLQRSYYQMNKFCKCASGGYYGHRTYRFSRDNRSAQRYIDYGNNENWATKISSQYKPVYQVKCNDYKWYYTNRDYYYGGSTITTTTFKKTTRTTFRYWWR